MIDLMHIGEKVVGVHAVFAHHAAHGSAIAPVIVLLDPTGFLCGNPEEGADELANPRIDLMPKINVMRIQRVVEVEHPGVDIGKEAGFFHHRSIMSSPPSTQLRTGRGDPYTAEYGSPRCLCFPGFATTNIWDYGSPLSRGRRWNELEEDLPSRHRKAKRLAATRHIDAGKAADREAAGAAVALFIDFELALAGAKLGSAAPIQWLVPELKRAVVGIDRFRKTENASGVTNDIGMQAFAGIDPVPAAADHGLAVVRGHRGHDLVRRVIAPGEPGGRRRLDRLDHAREKIRSLHDILRQAPVFQESR